MGLLCYFDLLTEINSVFYYEGVVKSLKILSVALVVLLSTITISIVSFITGFGPAKGALAEYSGYTVDFNGPFTASTGDTINVSMLVKDNRTPGSPGRTVKVQGEFDGLTTQRGATNPTFSTTGTQIFATVGCPILSNPDNQPCNFNGIFLLDPGETVTVSGPRVAGPINVGGSLGWSGSPLGYIVAFSGTPVGIAWQNITIR